MKTPAKLEEGIGKLVGRRRLPSTGLCMTPAQQVADAIAWKRAFRTLPIPKGVYRFRTHEEADKWLWEMLTRKKG